MRKIGKIIKTGDLNVWPHEQYMANVLAKTGYTIEFVKPINIKGMRTPRHTNQRDSLRI